MLYLVFLKKIRHRSILGLILGITIAAAGLFLPLIPARAIIFNKPRIELYKEALITKSCLSEGFSVVYYYSNGNLIAQNDCQTGRIIIDEAGYCVVTGQPAYVGENFVAVEDFNGTIETDNFVVVPAIASFPNDFISSLLAYAGRLFTDLNVLIILAIGLPVAFWIIKKILTLLKK
jgi:hypothetical protein